MASDLPTMTVRIKDATVREALAAYAKAHKWSRSVAIEDIVTKFFQSLPVTELIGGGIQRELRSEFLTDDALSELNPMTRIGDVD